MFGKKQSRSERSFSVMLAEELLRAELKKLYGDNIKFFQCDTVAMPPRSPVDGESYSEAENKLMSLSDGFETRERYVNLTGIIGPFERLYPDNPPEDRRRCLRRVEAVCRVFSIETGCIEWKAHFLKFVVKNEHGQVTDKKECIYEDGPAEGKKRRKNADNPCKDMVDSQIAANYPTIHRELHGGAQTATTRY